MEDAPPPVAIKAKGSDGQTTSAAAQLRVAVTAKLGSMIGSETDEVLVDYVVVMLSHGRSSGLMVQDLDAFLGSKAQDFVAW